MSSPDLSGVTASIANLSITTTDAPQELVRETEEQVTPRQTQFPSDTQQSPEAISVKRKREKLSESSDSGSDTEIETANTTKMPSGSSSSKHHSSSSSKKHSSSSSSSSKHHAKGDDWSDVTEPEERRRIQNRIAQRKFREYLPLSNSHAPGHPTNPHSTGEKTRDQKERQEREARNQELAGSSYTVPLGSDLDGSSGGADQLSGLPWGGLNIPHMVARGHESASQQGSRRGASDQYDQQQQQGGSSFYDPQLWGVQDMSYGAGGFDVGDDRYFDTSASSSSPSYFSYDAFPGDCGSNQ